MNDERDLFHTLSKKYGTPLYIYFEEVISRNVKRLQKALSPFSHSICYAVKANSNLSLLSLLNRLGCGFDIVSEGELRRVRKAVGDSRSVVFAGVGKAEKELRYAIEQGVKFINVESAQELAIISRIASELQTPVPVAFRINPDVEVLTHPYLATGISTSKFGIQPDEARSMWGTVKGDPYVRVVGVSCHIGSQVSDPAPLLGAYQQVVRLANEFRDHGAPIEYVDFGGGFGISYSGRYAPLEIEKFAAALSEIVKGSNYTLIVEPGKYLIAEAGVLLTKILYTKQSLSRKFLVCDAGMNDLIRPALYDAYHKIDVVSQQLNPLTPLQVVDVVGPICESGCYLAQERELPEGQPGDLLAIRDAGAYGFSMASHYNTRPLPAEVLISSEGTDRLIRERESYDDLLRAELPFLAE